MSSISFTVSPENLIPQERTEQLPPFMAKKKPTRLDKEVHIQVIPPQGDITWTTGTFIQPR